MERISKELIQKGIEKDVIRFGMEDEMLIATIGDNWFFISNELCKNEKSFSKEELVDMVYSIINDEPINDKDEEFATECLYYKAVLLEQIGSNFRNKMEIKYYEIEFDNHARGNDFGENCIGDYSICIIGTRKPTFEEAEEFCNADMKKMGYKYVVGVTEIDAEEAHTFFDMRDEEKFPIFGE